MVEERLAKDGELCFLCGGAFSIDESVYVSGQKLMCGVCLWGEVYYD